MLAQKTWSRRWGDLSDGQQILLTGDGSALFAMCWRLENLEARPMDLIVAVERYRRLIGDEVGLPLYNMPKTRLASAYRAAWPGCSFAELADALAIRRGGPI